MRDDGADGRDEIESVLHSAISRLLPVPDAVSIALVMIQPLLVHGWCTLCLASALVSVLMIGPAMDEMLARLQYLKRRRQSVAAG